MSNLRFPATLLVLAAAGVALLSPIEAAARDRLVHARTPAGGYVAGRHVDREPGSTTVTRGIRTHGGHGIRDTRTADWGDGAIETSRDRRYAGGATAASRSSLVRNADGSISSTRSRSASTSDGRGYSANRDVSIDGDLVSIDRRLTTGSGRSITSSRTYPRRGD